jgi:hypothetical protein
VSTPLPALLQRVQCTTKVNLTYITIIPDHSGRQRHLLRPLRPQLPIHNRLEPRVAALLTSFLQNYYNLGTVMSLRGDTHIVLFAGSATLWTAQVVEYVFPLVVSRVNVGWQSRTLCSPLLSVPYACTILPALRGSDRREERRHHLLRGHLDRLPVRSRALCWGSALPTSSCRFGWIGGMRF